MKLLDVALKDMRQSLRSLTGIMFMFVVPILVTALFYVMFGGSTGDEGFTLPQTTVQVVNLDAGELPANVDVGALATDNLEIAAGEARSMGDVLLQILQSAAFSDLLAVTEAPDVGAARRAVDDQDAGVAIIIPANFTEALMLPRETAVIELYQDPTLTIGPGIVQSIIDQFAGSFSFPKIGAAVTIEQLAGAGVVVDDALAQEIIGAFTTAAMAQNQAQNAPLTVQAPTTAGPETDVLSQILGQIMGGMMIFFAFFTGAGTLQSILVEEERGTLPRLFTTPTPISVILGGKVLGTIIILVVQLTVLLIFGRLVFGINWGARGPLLLAAAGIVVLSAASGLLLVSLLKNTRQAGAIYGGVLTITGMLGMITIFTGGVASPTIETITLLVPQGWAVRGLQMVMNGAGGGDLLPIIGGYAVWTFLFVAVALYRLQRRFA